MPDVATELAKCEAEAKAVAVIPDVPADLAPHVGTHDMGGGCCNFTVLGYVVADRTTSTFTLDGEPLAVQDRVAYMSWCLGGKAGRRPGWYGRVVREETTAPWLYAVVTGNAVTAEGYFREQGFSRAFAGSPVYVAVRPVEG